MSQLHFRAITLLLVTAIAALAGCQSDSGGASGTDIATPIESELRVTDVTGKPIVGAVVTITGGGVLFQASTDGRGFAALAGAPSGEVTMSVTAPEFEPVMFATRLPHGVTSLSLRAAGEWAVGRAIALGARTVERAANGSTLSFSVDVTVIDGSSTAIETLTSADFEVLRIDCGWGGPRDCASDAAGNASPPNGGNFAPDGPAQSFGLRPPSARRPYLVGVLAERSNSIPGWNTRISALKSFFAALGGNDVASLAAVETIGGAATLTVLGPFTSDGRTYFDALHALDGLAGSAADPPAMLPSITESIRRAAAARDTALTAVDPTVLVLATPWMTIADIDAATTLARQLDVRISVVVGDNYGLPEMAVRTGGFVAQYADPRQLGPIFGAMDSLLAGTLPYYQMQFRIKGSPGTFVIGGNAKVRLKVRVPTSLPTYGVVITFDVPIDS